MITSLLRKRGFTGVIAAHIIPWNSAKANTTHFNPNQAYSYDDPNTIGRALTVLEKNGIRGCFFTYQGPFATAQHAVVMEFVRQVQEREMLFALVMDPWSAGGDPNNKAQATLDLTKCFANTDVQWLLNSPAYIPEKAILDYGTGADYSKVGVKNPIWYRHTHYSWVEVATPKIGDPPVNPIPDLAKSNANPTMMVPGISLQFSDGGWPAAAIPGGIDRNLSSWNGKTAARYVSDRAGNYLFDQLAITPMNKPYIGLVTLDDFHEGTAWLVPLCIEADERVY